MTPLSRAMLPGRCGLGKREREREMEECDGVGGDAGEEETEEGR